MVIAFTGHRPEKLPWGNDETDPRCQALKLQIRENIRRKIHEGFDSFSCGMARGCDFFFAEAVLEMKKQIPAIQLQAYVPCKSQPDRWPEKDRQRYRSILFQCDEVCLVQRVYSKGCMLKRNRLMIDRADALMSVWDGTAGGTGAAVRYARHQKKDVISLWF